ncbi:MAG: DUF6502 family protein [Burkholderiaceae bacterium]
MTAPAGSATGPASPETVEWFAGLFEPLAGLAIERGVKLPALIDSLKLALVRAATSVVAAEAAVPNVAAGPGPGAGGQGVGASQPARSDSRLAVMTGVHRKDLRRIRTTGSTARPKGRSIAGEVFARWQSDPRFLTSRGRPRVLARQTEDPTHPSFEELVTGITRDVHPRPVLDELVRLRMVETVGSGEARVRLLQSAFVPVADSAQMLQLAHDNLADHCAAVAANLSGDGRRFLEQALFSDGLTAESARRFNRETLAAWESAFATLMPRLRELYEADRLASEPRDHRVRLGMYGLAAPTRDNR